MKPLQLLCFALMFSTLAIAQSSQLNHKDFLTTGTAQAAGAHCFQLTPNHLWQGGTVWYKKVINLNDAFEIEVDLKFGCDDDGADGMVFIFHPRLRDGFQGEGIGFGGLKPAFGIEMDTYENPHLADPYFDHIALVRDGKMHHALGINGPVPILAGFENIEDCKTHRVKISWSAIKKNIKVTIDGDLRMNTDYDIVENIFAGNPNVYWGVSSATGGKHNQHLLCLEKLTFTAPGSFDMETANKLLNGEDYTLKEVTFISGKTSLADNSEKELDKLVKFLKVHPKHHVFINGHTDDVGSASKNKTISKKRADKVAAYLESQGISKDRIKARGLGESEPLVENDSPENRIINRRISVFVMIPKV